MRLHVAMSLSALAAAVLLAACQPSAPADGEAAADAAKAAPVEQPEPAAAPEPAPAKTGAPASAVFAFAALEGGDVQPIIGALAEDPGVASAKPDLPAKRLTVAYDSGKTNPQALLERILQVKAGATFEGAADPPPPEGAMPPEHNCGGCPMKNSCGGDLP